VVGNASKLPGLSMSPSVKGIEVVIVVMLKWRIGGISLRGHMSQASESEHKH
jgi:hypothetical protein